MAQVWASLVDRLRADRGRPSGTGPPTVPGWTVKDQLSHLIGIERMLLGDPPPPPLERGARPRPQRLRGDERGVGRGPPGRARARGAGRVRRDHQPADRGAPGHAQGEVRRGGLEPGGRGALPRVHGDPDPRQLGPRAGHPPGAGPTRRSQRGRRGASPSTGASGPCPSWWASGWRRRTAPRCCSR